MQNKNVPFFLFYSIVFRYIRTTVGDGSAFFRGILRVKLDWPLITQATFASNDVQLVTTTTQKFLGEATKTPQEKERDQRGES
jgi:hypothetical protein